MDLSIFSPEIKKALERVNLNKLYEIRLRIGFCIKLNVNGQVCFLTENGASLIKNNAIIVKKEDINFVLEKVTENSVYAFNEQIKKGFLTSKDGIRIGLAGECVFENDKIITIKNISSLNFRIPHEIDFCSKEIEKYIYNGQTIYNSLIISSPFCGKTTILKDLSLNFNIKLNKSILIIDERGEFVNIKGENIDKITFSDKLFAFNYAIRSLSPHLVITDEIANDSDWALTEFANNSGVKIVGSMHAESIKDVKSKPFFRNSVFERYFVLDSFGAFGQLTAVYDKDFNKL